MIHRFLCVFLVSIFTSMHTAHAADVQSPTVQLFWGEGCPHCAKARTYIQTLQKEYPDVSMQEYEVWNNAENRTKLIAEGKRLNADVSGVPFTVVGDEYFIGWYNDATTGRAVRSALVSLLQPPDAPQQPSSTPSKNTQVPEVQQPAPTNNHPEPFPPEEHDAIAENVPLVGQLQDSDSSASEQNHNDESAIALAQEGHPDTGIPEHIDIPFLGSIETKTLSLPVFTFIIAALDGFNPCAMWTLLFLISLLLGMEDRRKMWILGTAFIVSSAAVYFLFLAAWLNILLFIGFLFWVRLSIGVVALGGGGFYLKEFFFNPHGGCHVTGGEQRQRVFAKLKEFTHQRNFWIALFGIILLAFAVNLVELICSAGLPAVYTQVLSMSNLSMTQYYLYLLFYILVFMLDDLCVFFAAMITLKMSGISDKYSHLSHLIGGILMVIIGILLIWKPEWLMFG